MTYIALLCIFDPSHNNTIMNPLSKDLTAASSIPLVLSILSKGESYGYDIIQQVHLLSDGTIKWTDGMLYPLLHKMENRGYIKSEWKAAENGRRRKYYQITNQGKKQLAKDQAAWNFVTSIFDQLWKPTKNSI